MEELSKINQENNIEKPKTKEGVDFVFAQNPELAETGTKEQYSEYLDTIFPESKVKDIEYHGTKANEIFDIYEFKNSNYFELQHNLIYFTSSKEDAKIGGTEKSDIKLKIISNIVNIKNPAILSKGNIILEDNSIKEKYGLWFNNELVLDLSQIGIRYVINLTKNKIEELIHKYNLDGIITKIFPVHNIGTLEKKDWTIVFEPEQIHILGSKKDIEGFKKFVENHQDSHT